MIKRTRWALAALSALWLTPAAQAGDRLLGTWGVTSVEGAGGGGLVPWATIAGTGSDDQAGGNAGVTRLRTNGGYDLTVDSAAIGIRNRVEVSMAHWSFRLADTAPGQRLGMTVIGAKWRLRGDAVYDQDSPWPQLTLGVQLKADDDFTLPSALGARHSSDVEAYLSATKVWLSAAAGRNVLGNLTLRATRANQFGLLGFGGNHGDRYRLEPEASLAVLPTDRWALGAEWRAKPDLLSVYGYREQSAYDLFAAWFPCRHVSLTAAWVHLGNVAVKPDQHSWYLSAQALF